MNSIFDVRYNPNEKELTREIEPIHGKVTVEKYFSDAFRKKYLPIVGKL